MYNELMVSSCTFFVSHFAIFGVTSVFYGNVMIWLLVAMMVVNIVVITYHTTSSLALIWNKFWNFIGKKCEIWMESSQSENDDKEAEST